MVYLSATAFFLGLWLTVVIIGRIVYPPYYRNITLEVVLWALCWTVWWYVPV